MRTKTSLPIATLGALLLAAVSVQGPALAGTAELATVSTGPGGIHWQPVRATDGFILTVAGEGRWLRSQFGPGETPAFQPVDDSGQPLPNGEYTWELRPVQREPGADANAGANGRSAASEGAQLSRAPMDPITQSGAFTITNGTVVAGGNESETTPENRVADTGGGSPEELVIAEDLIVQGSECVGVDCASAESFDFDTIRLKENNLQIHFSDTSSTGSFPSNDWRLIANDSANGGRNVFYLEDADAGREVFSVEADARTNSLYVDTGGRVGFGTSTPAVELHTADGDTPTLRLEQDGSSGFTPQTWDVAGNEANFFVRDVTGGSLLPLRIRPGAPTSSVDIRATGVGIGSASPTSDLDVNDLDGNGFAAFRLTRGGDSWAVSHTPSGALTLNLVGSGGQELVVREQNDPVATLGVQGPVQATEFKTSSSRAFKTAFEALDPQEMLAKLVALPVNTWRFTWENDSKRHVGPVAEDFRRLFGLGDGETIASVDADGVMMAAIQGLKRLLDETRAVVAAKDAELTAVKRTNAALEARLTALETRVADRDP